MHQDTLREIVDACASIGGSILKDTFVRRQELNSMERRKEMEVELAKAKRDAGGHDESTHDEPMAPQATAAGVGLGAGIDDLKAREDCAMCQQLLDAIKAAPPDVQAKALTEYGEFRHMSRQGASEKELRRFLDGSETLQELLEQQVAG